MSNGDQCTKEFILPSQSAPFASIHIIIMLVINMQVYMISIYYIICNTRTILTPSFTSLLMETHNTINTAVKRPDRPLDGSSPQHEGNNDNDSQAGYTHFSQHCEYVLEQNQSNGSTTSHHQCWLHN